MEASRLCLPVTADSHHFDEKLDPDPDPHFNKKSHPEPIGFRISVKVMWIQNHAGLNTTLLKTNVNRHCTVYLPSGARPHLAKPRPMPEGAKPRPPPPRSQVWIWAVVAAQRGGESDILTSESRGLITE
jgi:hypothetical protein